jgi:cell division protein FtsZ
MRAPRMPNIDELPLPGQTLMRSRQQAPAVSETDSRRRTLLERLATFGMSRAEEPAAAPAPRQAPQQAYQPRPANPSPVHAEYAKRPQAPQRPAAQMDPHGRAQPRAEDDQLEIPAFLRRQSN